MVHGGLSVVLWLALIQGSQARAEDFLEEISQDGMADSGTTSDTSVDSGLSNLLDTAMGLSHTGALSLTDSGLLGQGTDSGQSGGDTSGVNFGDTAALLSGGTGDSLDSDSDSVETGETASGVTLDSSSIGGGTGSIGGGTGGMIGGDSAAQMGSAGIVINEFLPNPDQTDGGNEWVELLNVGTVAVDLSGWTFQRSTSGSWSSRYVFSALTLQAGERLLLGGEFVASADINLAVGSTLEMGNASSSGDAVRLLDSLSDAVDTVIYGPNNSDSFEDDNGTVALSVAPKPGSGDSIGRLPDGADSDDSGVDFALFGTPTPGASNGTGLGLDTGDTSDTGGSVSMFPAGSVIINEFLPDPGSAGGDKGYEWIEFLNTTAADIDLQGWSIERSTSGSFSTRHTFSSATISPGDYYVLGGEFVAGTDAQLVTGTGIELGNASSSGDLVRLVDPAGGVIDTVIYGPDNSDGFENDDGVVNSSVAPKPSADASLARIPDGVDTNDSGVDFQLISTPTMGSVNTDPCGSPAVAGLGLVINEFIPNPASTDTDFEWVELYNGGSSTLNLSGWRLNTGTSSFTKAGIIPTGTEILPGGFLVVGQTETSVPEVDVAAPGFSLGNAGSTNADGLRLEDCEGIVVDTVIYGGDNSNDQWVDDSGAVAGSLAPTPKEGVSIARVDDGVDTDMSAVDFEIPVYSTPGQSNDAVPTTCGGPTSGIVINEFVSNSVGSDSEVKAEWVELFHGGTEDMDLKGWAFQYATSTFSTKYTWEEETIMSPGDFILIGDEAVPGADIVVSLSLPNASTNSDGLRLIDCRGFAADTVVYGSPNTDEIMDDTNTIATNTAVSPGEGQSSARVQDGYDTNNSRFDFLATTDMTPGTPNPENEPVVCAPHDGSVTLNEALVDPEGSDSEVLASWVEFYNSSAEDASIAGWWLAADDTFEDLSAVLPGGAVVPTMGWFVVGEELADVKDATVPLDLGNGSGGDGIRLYDCEGTPVDTIVYGDEENEDLVVDDDGEVPVNLPNPGSDESVARVEDGVDTNDVSDWKVARRTTPGESNLTEGVVDTGDGPGGCSKSKEGSPSGCGSSADPNAADTGGCNTMPLPLGGLEILAGAIAMRRRRRED